MAKTIKHPKLDPYFISLKQKYELTHVQNKFHKEGIQLSLDDIKAIVKTVGKSRRKVYAYIRNLIPQSKK